MSYWAPLKQLSTRDKLWLMELSHGAGMKQLTEATSAAMAKNRMTVVYRYLGVKSCTQAVAEALRRGIIR